MNIQTIKFYGFLLLTLAILIASFVNRDAIYESLLSSLSVVFLILCIHNMSNLKKINKYEKNKRF
jgi:succinate-acetate transporter protein